MLDVDLTFPHSYNVGEVLELPGTGKLEAPLFYFPRPKCRPEHDGLWIRVCPTDGDSWVGVFAFGDQSSPGFVSRVLSSPDPDRICIVSRGAAYLVKVDEPEVWEGIAALPVRDVRLLPEHELILFADFTRLAAYGRAGLAWRSPTLCFDELKILNVSHDTIEGVGYDPTTEQSRFAVDIRTGRSLMQDAD